MKRDPERCSTWPIDLAEFAEAYRGQVVHVCVDGSHEELIDARSVDRTAQRMAGLFMELYKPDTWQLLIAHPNAQTAAEWQRVEKEIFAWLADLWSQHADPETHWSAAQIEVLSDADPALYRWLVQRSMARLQEHRRSTARQGFYLGMDPFLFARRPGRQAGQERVH